MAETAECAGCGRRGARRSSDDAATFGCGKCYPHWPEANPRLSETDVHTDWAVDASTKPALGGIVVCHDQAEAQRLALAYGLPLLKRRVVIVRTVADWEGA